MRRRSRFASAERTVCRGANAGADGVPGRGAVMLVTSGGELPRAQGARYPRNLTGHQDGTGWSRTGYVGRPDSVSGNRAQDRRTDACRRLRPAGHRRRYSCAPGDEPLGLRCHANTRADHGGTCGQATRAILDRDQRKAGAVWQVDLHRRRAPALLDLPGAVNVPPGGGCQASLTLPQGGSLFQDAQSGEESTDLRCVSAKCLRDVGYAHGPQQADRRVSEGSHHFRTGTLADPARVLAHCDVTYVVRTILDRPMPPGPFEQLSRAGHRPRNTGDEVADLVRGLAVLDHLALDLSDLANTRPIQIIVQRRRRLQRATLDSTVSLVEGRRRVHGVIPDSLLPRGKKPLPREGRRPSGCHSGASVGCL